MMASPSPEMPLENRIRAHIESKWKVPTTKERLFQTLEQVKAVPIDTNDDAMATAGLAGSVGADYVRQLLGANKGWGQRIDQLRKNLLAQQGDHFQELNDLNELALSVTQGARLDLDEHIGTSDEAQKEIEAMAKGVNELAQMEYQKRILEGEPVPVNEAVGVFDQSAISLLRKIGATDKHSLWKQSLAAIDPAKPDAGKIPLQKIIIQMAADRQISRFLNGERVKVRHRQYNNDRGDDTVIVSKKKYTKEEQEQIARLFVQATEEIGHNVDLDAYKKSASSSFPTNPLAEKYADFMSRAFEGFEDTRPLKMTSNAAELTGSDNRGDNNSFFVGKALGSIFRGEDPNQISNALGRLSGEQRAGYLKMAADLYNQLPNDEPNKPKKDNLRKGLLVLADLDKQEMTGLTTDHGGPDKVKKTQAEVIGQIVAGAKEGCEIMVFGSSDIKGLNYGTEKLCQDILNIDRKNGDPVRDLNSVGYRMIYAEATKCVIDAILKRLNTSGAGTAQIGREVGEAIKILGDSNLLADSAVSLTSANKYEQVKFSPKTDMEKRVAFLEHYARFLVTGVNYGDDLEKHRKNHEEFFQKAGDYGATKEEMIDLHNRIAYRFLAGDKILEEAGFGKTKLAFVDSLGAIDPNIAKHHMVGNAISGYDNGRLIVPRGTKYTATDANITGGFREYAFGIESKWINNRNEQLEKEGSRAMEERLKPVVEGLKDARDLTRREQQGRLANAAEIELTCITKARESNSKPESDPTFEAQKSGSLERADRIRGLKKRFEEYNVKLEKYRQLEVDLHKWQEYDLDSVQGFDGGLKLLGMTSNNRELAVRKKELEQRVSVVMGQNVNIGDASWFEGGSTLDSQLRYELVGKGIEEIKGEFNKIRDGALTAESITAGFLKERTFPPYDATKPDQKYETIKIPGAGMIVVGETDFKLDDEYSPGTPILYDTGVQYANRARDLTTPELAVLNEIMIDAPKEIKALMMEYRQQLEGDMRSGRPLERAIMKMIGRAADESLRADAATPRNTEALGKIAGGEYQRVIGTARDRALGNIRRRLSIPGPVAV